MCQEIERIFMAWSSSQAGNMGRVCMYVWYVCMKYMSLIHACLLRGRLNIISSVTCARGH